MCKWIAFLFYAFFSLFIYKYLSPATALNSVPALAQEVIRNFTLIQGLKLYATTLFLPAFKGKPTYSHEINRLEQKQMQGKAARRGEGGRGKSLK